MLRAILFDFDGTIADTEPLHYSAFAEVLARRGITLDAEDYFERYLSLTDRECLERILEQSGRADLRGDLRQLFQEKVEAMARRLDGEVPLCCGVTGFIAEAALVGPLAIVSGALRAEVVKILERASLRKFFPVIVAAEDVRRGKPDPEGYRLGWQALRGLGLHDLAPAECLAIEDSPKGILAARAAGLKTLALAHSRPAAALGEADRVAADYAQIRWDDLRSLFAD